MVTAVIGDFTGSFTSLASSFGDDFIIPSPPNPSAVVRRGGGVQSSGGGTGWQNKPEAQAEGGAGPGVGSQVRLIPSCPTQSQRAGGSGVGWGGRQRWDLHVEIGMGDQQEPGSGNQEIIAG